jgi:hypothetical protein
MDINISEEAEQLLDEMGEAKIKRYMMSFLKVKTKDKESSDFFFEFSEYLKSCIPNNNGYKHISTFSFEQFLLKKYHGFNVFDLD